jgi:hypothetical protein
MTGRELPEKNRHIVTGVPTYLIFGTMPTQKRMGSATSGIIPCRIDKTSSAELSEAINSMFQWY